ncbi:MAG: hypothetical protein JOZ00_24765 [Mycobacterium sp.]|uniref:hypothetical protein n=1 Tax=Mycobacterium sp. TaxID=1785 RepID=UPI001ED0B047|nr:hypothetical protein [Mycobacterium sp.]MBV8789880.1 hypothetical protein [Mycobacterium sp.]
MRHSTATAPASAAGEAAALYRTPRVFLAAAWVAIVAGIVFIISVIFFTGMALGHHGGHHHHHKHPAAWMHPHRGPGGPGGPGQFGPGGPGGQGGQGGQSNTPSTTPGAPSGVRPSMAPGLLPPSVFRSAAITPGATGGAPAVIVLTR